MSANQSSHAIDEAAIRGVLSSYENALLSIRRTRAPIGIPRFCRLVPRTRRSRVIFQGHGTEMREILKLSILTNYVSPVRESITKESR
jgi:hypothetical protein